MTEEDRIYCGHRIQQEDCPGCVHYDLCPHCGEQMIWFDMFDIPWCKEMYLGPDKETS